MSTETLEFEILGLETGHNVKADPEAFFTGPLDYAYIDGVGVAKARPFDLDLLGPSAPFLLALSQVKHQDPLLMTMSILTTISAKLGGFLDGEQAGKNFSFPLSLHTMIVGPKGDNKDPGLLLGRKQLERCDSNRMPEYRRLKAAYDTAWSIYAKIIKQLEDAQVDYGVRKAQGQLDPGETQPKVEDPSEPTIRLPLFPNSTYIKGTPEGLEKANQDVWGSCNWFNEEGSAIFMRAAAGQDAANVLTLMISGIQGSHSASQNAGEAHCRDVKRFVFSLLTSVQPRLFFKWIRTVYDTRTELDTGWLERCLLLWTTPTPILSTDHDQEKVDLSKEVLNEVFDFLDQIGPIYDPAVLAAAAETHRTGKSVPVDEHKWSDGGGKIIPRIQWTQEAIDLVDPYAKEALSARAESAGSGWSEDEAPLDIKITNIMKSGQHISRLATLIEVLWWAQRNRKKKIKSWNLDVARRELPVVSKEAAQAALSLVTETLLPMKSDLMTMPLRKDSAAALTDIAERASRFSATELKTETFDIRELQRGRWIKRATLDPRLKMSPDTKPREIYEQTLALLTRDNVALEVEPGVWAFNPQLSNIHNRFTKPAGIDDWRTKNVDLNALRMSAGSPFTDVTETGEGNEHFMADIKDVPQEFLETQQQASADPEDDFLYLPPETSSEPVQGGFLDY